MPVPLEPDVPLEPTPDPLVPVDEPLVPVYDPVVPVDDPVVPVDEPEPIVDEPVPDVVPEPELGDAEPELRPLREQPTRLITSTAAKRIESSFVMSDLLYFCSATEMPTRFARKNALLLFAAVRPGEAARGPLRCSEGAPVSEPLRRAQSAGADAEGGRWSAAAGSPAGVRLHATAARTSRV